jgi:hypothetical protein
MSNNLFYFNGWQWLAVVAPNWSCFKNYQDQVPSKEFLGLGKSTK